MRPDVIAIAVDFSALIGAAFGLYPARTDLGVSRAALLPAIGE